MRQLVTYRLRNLHKVNNISPAIISHKGKVSLQMKITLFLDALAVEYIRLHANVVRGMLTGQKEKKPGLLIMSGIQKMKLLFQGCLGI